MATRDDVLRRLGGLDSQNQAPTAPEPPHAGGAPLSEGVNSVVVPFPPDSQQDVLAQDPDAEMTSDDALGDAARDLVKPLVKAWLTSNLPQSLDNSICEAVKPLLTNWMDANLPRMVDAAMRELFKPLLVAWLDRNLASTIERGAHREIARLTGKVSNG
jgi:cell pole-organizing protein PopZ